nr:RNA polymerase sigma factor WhiG [Gemmatimonadota bacterium]
QRTVLSLHYFEDLNAREIANVLGVSESRVSQIRSKALAELRRIMTPLRASA